MSYPSGLTIIFVENQENTAQVILGLLLYTLRNHRFFPKLNKHLICAITYGYSNSVVVVIMFQLRLNVCFRFDQLRNGTITQGLMQVL